MAARFNPIIDKLEELKDFFEKLKEIEGKIEKVQRIIDEIDELIDLLNNSDPPELKAFTLLRMFIEKVKDFDPGIPLLSDFLELYIEALKSAESICKNILDQYDWLDARIYDIYKREREKKEKELEDGISIDEITERRAEIDEQAHGIGMDGIGSDIFGRYAKKFKDKYDTGRKRRIIEKERDRAENEDRILIRGGTEIGDKTDDLPVIPLPTPKPSPDKWDWLLVALNMMKERMTSEEWEEFVKRLRELFPPVPK